MFNAASHFLRFRLPAILWALFIFIASSIPEKSLPRFVRHISDKVIHGAVFFIFGLLVYRALEPREKAEKPDWKRLLVSVAAVIAYGISDEVHQAFVPGRTVDIFDASADAVGGILAALVIYLAARRKNAAC